MTDVNVNKITDRIVKMYTKLHKDSEFESKHKRDSDGKFAKKEGSKTTDKNEHGRFANDEFVELYGLVGEEPSKIRDACWRYIDTVEERLLEVQFDADPYEKIFYQELKLKLSDAYNSRDYATAEELSSIMSYIASKESADSIRNQFSECVHNPTPERIDTVKDAVREYRKSGRNRIEGILPDVEGVYFGDQIEPFADDDVVMAEVFESVLGDLKSISSDDDNPRKPTGEQDWKMDIATKLSYDKTDTIHRGTTNFELDSAKKNGFWGASADSEGEIRRAKFKFVCMSTSERIAEGYSKAYEGRFNTDQTIVLKFPKRDIREFAHVVEYSGDVDMHDDKEEDYGVDDKQTTYWARDREVRYDLDRISTSEVKPICTVYSTKFREMEPEEKAEFEAEYKDLFSGIEYKEWSTDNEEYDL